MNTNLDKIIEKINNLFDLANNNPNENEAMAAALKAQELMAKYNVSMVQLNDTETKEEIVTVGVNVNDINKNSGAIKWRFDLAHVVANNFRCEVCFSNIGHVYFVGYKTDSEIAARTFTFLFQTGNRLSTNYYSKMYKRGKDTRGIKTAYLWGFTRGVQDKLEKQSFELMIVEPKEVKEHFEDMTKDYKRKSVKSSIKYGANVDDAYETGREDGNSVVDGTRLEDKAV